MTASEKVSYLKGLIAGLDLDGNDKTVKVINAIVDTLEEISESLSELELDVVDISDQVDAVDEDLAEVEDYLFESEDDEDEDVYEVKCPECGETMVVGFDMLDGTIQCSGCGADLELGIEEIDE